MWSPLYVEVAGAEDHTSGLVGDVHEQKGTLPRLAVFICHIVDVGVMANVREVLADGRNDRYFAG